MEKILPTALTGVDLVAFDLDDTLVISKQPLDLAVPLANCIYVGDALYPGGNDAVVNRLGIRTVPVGGVEDTKKFIADLLATEVLPKTIS